MPKGVEQSESKAEALPATAPGKPRAVWTEVLGVPASSYKLKACLFPRHTIGLDLQPCQN